MTDLDTPPSDTTAQTRGAPVLTEVLYDAVLGLPEEVEALFDAAAPRPDELHAISEASEILDAAGEFTIYDLESLGQNMAHNLAEEGEKAAQALAEEDSNAASGWVVRSPDRMVLELIGAAGDPRVLERSLDWVWGPSGAPFRGGEEELARDDGKHLHIHHAAHYNRDLNACYEVMEDGIVERIEAAMLLAQQRDVEEERASVAVAGAWSGWESSGYASIEAGAAAALSLRNSAYARMMLAQPALEMRCLAMEVPDEAGWELAVGRVRLQVLATQWWQTGDFLDAAQDGNGINAVSRRASFWRAVQFASGCETARAAGGEAAVVAWLLGRSDRRQRSW